MAKNMVTVKYVDGANQNWCMWADKATIEATGNAAKLGATVTAGGCPPVPTWLKPRYVVVKDQATGLIFRRVVCYTATASAFTTPGTTLTMSPYRGSTVATATYETVARGHDERVRNKNTDDPTLA